MLQFQPLGFCQQLIQTSLGIMVYYSATEPIWPIASIPKDKPPLVFLHSLGGGSSAYEWSKIYPAFAADYRIIAPDLLGWGQSSHPPRSYQVEDYLKLLTELLEWVGQPAIAIASSLTAGITVRLAIQRPDLFDQLFLVSPAGYADFGGDYGRNLAAQIAKIPGIDQALYALGAANPLAVQSFLTQILFANPARITPETIAAYLASAQQFNAEYAALSSLRGDLCFDLALYLPQLRTRTAIAWGTKSRFGTPTLGKRLAQLNPTAIHSFLEIPEVGVLPHLEDPAIVIGLLRRVLGE
ncbi:MAG: alpha/beta hydrolase [Oculatellaceae cyanobacterium Prado106]|jgi:pimeloyl-ACP methyl ester carboxylesterase|nr:alpha/beta hydrolase [Oculatellaceae cyanobacterium Prado106]